MTTSDLETRVQRIVAESDDVTQLSLDCVRQINEFLDSLRRKELEKVATVLKIGVDRRASNSRINSPEIRRLRKPRMRLL